MGGLRFLEGPECSRPGTQNYAHNTIRPGLWKTNFDFTSGGLNDPQEFEDLFIPREGMNAYFELVCSNHLKGSDG